jgi:hypothetical protein
MPNKIERWNAAFASMDDRARAEALRIAEQLANDHPRKGETLLSLVASNLLGRHTQGLGQPEHIGAPSLVGSVK